MTITEFLEARIVEDEQQAGIYRELGWGPAKKYGMDVFGSARVLAECTVKRLILAEHSLDDHSTRDYCETCADWANCEVGEGPPGVEYPCPTVKALAVVYVDHPDYRKEWALNAL